MIHVIDEKTEEILSVLSPEEFWEDEFYENMKGAETFKFHMSARNPKAAFFSVRRRIIIPGEDGEYKEFLLSDPILINFTKEIYSMGSYIDLKKRKIIDPITLTGQTASTAGQYVLEGTGYQLGVVEYAGLRTITFEDPVDAYDAIWMVAKEFGLEVKFRVEVDGDKVTGRFVDLIVRRGELSGKEAVFGKDIEGIERRETEAELVTALKCYGPVRDDGTRLMVIVEDEEAFQKWNEDGRHLWGVYEPQTDDQEMTEERLRSLGKTELAKRTKTQIQYTLTSVALEHVFGYEHEKVRLGDTNRVKDESKKPPIYLDARAISIKRSIKRRSRKIVEYGDFIEYTQDQINAEWKKIQDMFAKKLAELKQLYTWVMYAEDEYGNGISSSPAGKSFIGFAYNKSTQDHSDNPADYAWSKLQGDQGVPGQPGEDGQPTYTWIKYADDLNGTNMSDNPTGKKYIGLAHNKTTASESNNAADYTWALFQGPKGEKGDKGDQGLQGLQGPKGDQGIQGPKGVDGKSSYTHIAYANSADGLVDFSVSDSTNKAYIGMYVDFVEADSTNPAMYNWTLTKGADGEQGIPGPKGTDGKTPYLHIAYATNSTGTAGFSTTDSVGKTYIGQYTDFTQADSTDPSKYSWTLIKGEKGDTGPQGLQGIQGPAGKDGQTLYTWVKYADTPTSGMSDYPTGKAYIGLAYNKTTPIESTNYADYSWSLTKGEQGVQGPKGADGVTTYTWVKYADDASGNGMSDSPDGKRYLGLAYNKTTPTESTNKADYSWSPMYESVYTIEGGKVFAYPIGASINQRATSVTGILAIKTPIKSSFMTKLRISGYNYVSNKTSIDLEVSFYAYSTGILNHSFVNRGDYPISRVRVGRDASGNAVILLGDTATAWSYPAVQVESATLTYNTPPDSYQTGWSMEFTTDISVYSSLTELGGTDLKKEIENAMATADGKNTVFRQSTQPPTTNRKVGDLWFDTANGNRMYVWTGSWSLTKLDFQALAVGKLSAISADLGNVTAGDIRGVTVNLGDGKFIVDSDGNVTFKGTLFGATGSFDGNVTARDITVIGSNVYGIRFKVPSTARSGEHGLVAFEGEMDAQGNILTPLTGKIGAIDSLNEDTILERLKVLSESTEFEGSISASNQLFIEVKRSANQSIAANTMTKVQFDIAPTGRQTNQWSKTNHRFTAPETGVYLLDAYIVTTNVGQYVPGELYLYKNGALERRIDKQTTPGVTSLNMHGHCSILLNAADYIELDVFVGAACSLDKNSYLAITKLA